MTLRNRIMLLVAIGLLVATVPLGVMGIGMVRTATDRVLQERLAMTQGTAEHLNDRLAQGWGQLERLGDRIARSKNGSDLAVVRREFAAFAPQLPLFSGGLFLITRTRGVVVQESPEPALRLTLHLAAAGEALKTGRPQISPLIYSAGGVPVVVFVLPVFAGKDPGAIGGILDLSRPTLRTFIDGLAIGNSGHAAIVAHDGTVLASTNRAELFTKDEHPEFFARLIAGRRAVVERTEEIVAREGHREPHIMAFASLSSAPWGIGIGQDEEETYGPIRRLRDRIVLFEIAVLAAALLFAWLDTGAVASPLRALKEAAERIAGGALDQPVEVRRADEVGLLARSFETMRVALLQSLEENARLQERIQSLAMLEERERIAREMHDSVGQVLGYVNTKAQAVGTLLEQGRTAEAQTQLAELEDAARDVYADLRAAILDLRTAAGPRRGLLATLQEYVARFGEQSGVESRLIAEGNPAAYDFAPTVELHLIRIIQEALTNVRKHAAARRAWVRLTTDSEAIVVTVTDDGHGLEVGGMQARAWPGFGLQTMRERAEAIGGSFAVRSQIGVGTEVEVRLPLARRRVGDARAASR